MVLFKLETQHLGESCVKVKKHVYICDNHSFMFIKKGTFLKQLMFIPILGLMALSASKKSFDVHDQPIKKYFGVLLTISASSSEMTYAVVTEEANGEKHYRHITRQDFTYIAQGKWRMAPNVIQENLFDKYQIDWGYNDRNQLYCPILDSLWKVRYPEKPYGRGSKGWAKDQFKPNEAQLIYLWETFGIYNINTSYVEGEKLWLLLQLMNSPQWRNMYKNL